MFLTFVEPDLEAWTQQVFSPSSSVTNQHSMLTVFQRLVFLLHNFQILAMNISISRWIIPPMFLTFLEPVLEV